jgi:hypothetical protein
MPAVINSLGPPPERHADRVVAEIMRNMAKRHASVVSAVTEAFKSSRDGMPKAQRKMAERIIKAGAYSVDLYPGKRGKYKMIVVERVGWNPFKESKIKEDDFIPMKPQIVFYVSLMESKGNYKTDVTSYPMLFITHHAMSRAAQRLGMRDEAQLEEASVVIWNASYKFLFKSQDIKKCIDSMPGQGIRLPLDDDRPDVFVVLKKHEKWDALIAATVISREDSD